MKVRDESGLGIGKHFAAKPDLYTARSIIAKRCLPALKDGALALTSEEKLAVS
jgi:hypothetical protein